jgi:hypothetical protein
MAQRSLSTSCTGPLANDLASIWRPIPVDFEVVRSLPPNKKKNVAKFYNYFSTVDYAFLVCKTKDAAQTLKRRMDGRNIIGWVSKRD